MEGDRHVQKGEREGKRRPEPQKLRARSDFQRRMEDEEEGATLNSRVMKCVKPSQNSGLKDHEDSLALIANHEAVRYLWNKTLQVMVRAAGSGSGTGGWRGSAVREKMGATP